MPEADQIKETSKRQSGSMHQSVDRLTLAYVTPRIVLSSSVPLSFLIIHLCPLFQHRLSRRQTFRIPLPLLKRLLLTFHPTPCFVCLSLFLFRTISFS